MLYTSTLQQYIFLIQNIFLNSIVPYFLSNVLKKNAALLKHKNSTNLLGEEKINAYKKQFADDIADDLNIPSALGVLWTMLKETPSIDIFNLALDEITINIDFDTNIDELEASKSASTGVKLIEAMIFFDKEQKRA